MGGVKGGVLCLLVGIGRDFRLKKCLCAKGIYGREGDRLWEVVLVRWDEIYGVYDIRCMACGWIVDGGYGADWVVSDDRACWEARVKCSVIGTVVAGDDGIGGRGGGRSVALWVIEAWGGSWAGSVAVTRCGWRRAVESDSLGGNCGSTMPHSFHRHV